MRLMFSLNDQMEGGFLVERKKNGIGLILFGIEDCGNLLIGMMLYALNGPD